MQGARGRSSASERTPDSAEMWTPSSSTLALHQFDSLHHHHHHTRPTPAKHASQGIQAPQDAHPRPSLSPLEPLPLLPSALSRLAPALPHDSPAHALALWTLAGQARSQRRTRRTGRSRRAKDAKVVCRPERHRRRHRLAAHKGRQEGPRTQHGFEAQGAFRCLCSRERCRRAGSVCDVDGGRASEAVRMECGRGVGAIGSLLDCQVPYAQYLAHCPKQRGRAGASVTPALDCRQSNSRAGRWTAHVQSPTKLSCC